MMFNLYGTPYILDEIAENEILKRLKTIEERVLMLRNQGTLTDETLRKYYGEKRFEQVAESNAIEGSTLSVGETELAVLRGVTITGHDPAYIRDARDLDRALQRIAELGKDRSNPTDLSQLHEIHELLLGDRLGAGVFRDVRVAIRGSSHIPPKTRAQVVAQMTDWEKWSTENKDLPAPIRSTVLQAWLTHVHPYIDGNGRTSRAIGNLELIRAGYPSIIIKKKERDRYIEALSESDEAGDLRSFIDLVFDRIEGSLTGLEQSAVKAQGYNPVLEKVRLQQARQLRIWENSVALLVVILEDQLVRKLGGVGKVSVEIYDAPLDLNDFIEVCERRPVSRTWAFRIRLEVPSLPRVEKLAWINHRTARMYTQINKEGGPSLYWSDKNPKGYPPWISAVETAPFAVELTTKLGNGNDWYARLHDDTIVSIQTTELAERIASALVGAFAEPSS